MIRSKKDFREYIAADQDYLRPVGLKGRLIASLAKYPAEEIRRYLVYLRRQEYYINTAHGSRLKGLLGLFWERKKNRLGSRLGIEIGPNCFGKGLTIYHSGSVVVNSAVRAGENCRLHGGNCIGNNGKAEGEPRLGNGVDVGFGAAVIGDIEIADAVTIGANAVVNKSVPVPGSVAVGVPARVLER